jgi:tRNA(Ile)-lysidine synthase
MQDLFMQFASNLNQFGPFESNPTIGVAVSGGADSLALSLLAAEYVKHYGGKIIAITIDHDLRADSAQEALVLKQQLQQQNIEHHIIKWQHQDLCNANIQAKARDARYQLLTDFAQQHHILHLLVAHHENDQIETFLLQLARGSGIEGLSAMRGASIKGNTRILRPLLLGINSARLRGYLQEKGLCWAEDPSNTNNKFARVQLRELLKPQDSLQLKRLCSTIGAMQRANHSIKISTYAHMIKAVEIHPQGYASIDRSYFLSIPTEEAWRILAAALISIGGNIYTPRLNSLKIIYEKILAPVFYTSTLGGCMIVRQGHKIIIARQLPKNYQNTLMVNCKSFLWDNRFMITFCKNNNMMSGNFKIGYLGDNKLIKDQLLKEKIKISHIPKIALASLPVVVALDKVLEVPYIAYSGDDMRYIDCYFHPLKAISSL